ncbi:MAG: YkgJ family cysteine cluster protein [Promethearchaeota archaeon]
MKNKCNDCGICCMETQMPISIQDISRILENVDYRIEINDFSLKSEEGYYQLRNIDNRCFFFDIAEKKCSIYEFRPRGCMFYPLVFDLEKNKCILDDICPRKDLFVEKKDKIKRKCLNLKNFLKNELEII